MVARESEWPCLRRWTESTSPIASVSGGVVRRQLGRSHCRSERAPPQLVLQAVEALLFPVFHTSEGGELTHSGSTAYRASWCQSPLGSPSLLGQLAPAQSLALPSQPRPQWSKEWDGGFSFCIPPPPRPRSPAHKMAFSSVRLLTR